MSNNSLLKISYFLCHFSKIICGITIIAVAAIFIHFQINPSSYGEFPINISDSPSIFRIDTESYKGGKVIDINDLKLTSWNTASLYFTFLQYIASLILIYLSIDEFKKILLSVKKLETFRNTNVNAFRKIGFYCLLISFLNIFSYYEFGDYSKITFSISLNALPFALLAFILAEVFKEGNNLLEENQLTI